MMIKRKVNMMLLVFIGVFLCGCGQQEEMLVIQASESSTQIAVTVVPAEIAVYVCGQVVSPGVVYLSEDARVIDAVEAAGGLTEEAAAEDINLAARILDGEQVYVPDRQEAELFREQERERLSDYVNINTADAERLMTLPGIGESKAQDIIAYRQEHGDFTKIEELMNIPGIKESLFAKVKDKIVVD